MALKDPPNENAAFLGAKEIRERVRRILANLDQDLMRISVVATEHTKSVIATQLGGDAAAFATFYDSARALLLSERPESTVPARASIP